MGQTWSMALLVAAVAASVLLGVAGLLRDLPFLPGGLRHRARTRGCTRAYVTAANSWQPPGLFAGLFPAIINVPLSLAADSVLGRTTPTHLAIWHGFSPVLLLSMLTLAGVAILYRWREQLRPRYGHAH